MHKSLIALAFVAVAASPAVTRDAAPEAVPDGKPIQCLSLTQVRDTMVRNDQIIDFKVSGGKTYRNTLDTPCPQLGSEKRYQHEATLNQICSMDTITVLRSVPPLQHGASCSLGEFQPVKLTAH
jgi:hypothetical protein